MRVRASVGLRSWFAFLARLLCKSLLAVVLTSSASYADALRVSFGYGQGIDLYALSVQFDRKAPVHQFDTWSLTSHVDVASVNSTLTGPVLRIVQPERSQPSRRFVGKDVSRVSSPSLKSDWG